MKGCKTAKMTITGRSRKSKRVLGYGWKSRDAHRKRLLSKMGEPRREISLLSTLSSSELLRAFLCNALSTIFFHFFHIYLLLLSLTSVYLFLKHRLLVCFSIHLAKLRPTLTSLVQKRSNFDLIARVYH